MIMDMAEVECLLIGGEGGYLKPDTDKVRQERTLTDRVSALERDMEAVKQRLAKGGL